jgi:cell division protein FtsB
MGVSNFSRETLVQTGALCWLLLLGGLALAGPGGVLAWGESLAVLQQREARIHTLVEERAELRNRVALLDRDNADPDLVTELIRRNLNVAHPDEYIIELDRPR